MHFGYPGFWHSLPRWPRAHFYSCTSLIHPAKVTQCPPLTWEMVLYDELRMDMYEYPDTDAIGSLQDKTAMGTTRRGTGSGPRGGCVHAALFQLKTPKRWRSLNWNLEFQVINENMFFMTRRYNIIRYMICSLPLVLNQESVNVRNKSDHCLTFLITLRLHAVSCFLFNTGLPPFKQTRQLCVQIYIKRHFYTKDTFESSCPIY